MLVPTWSLLAALATAVSATVIRPNGHDDFCLHADKISVGGTVSIRRCNGRRNQNWNFHNVGEGSRYGMVHLIMDGSGDSLCLEAGGQWPNFKPRSGTRATLAKCPSGWHSARYGTDWLWDSETRRFELTDIATGLHYMLDNTDGRAQDGNPVQIWESTLEDINPNQVWNLAAVL